MTTTKHKSYLAHRGLTSEDCELLGIRHLSYDEATSKAYGFGKVAASPDGVLFSPFLKGERSELPGTGMTLKNLSRHT
ncbi:hypothetical protein Syn6312_3358 [Synechococcus sp. PCC 6312]|nr:hypothetical protein Syn6312_3358 [Synechococcus sp. PCC 6312]